MSSLNPPTVPAAIKPTETLTVTEEDPSRRLLSLLVPNLGSVSLAKRLVRPESYAQALASACDIPKWRRIANRLADYSERNDGFFFVQIGAHDGKSGDVVRPNVIQHSWKGLLVEPVPSTFRKLQANYLGHTGLRFANVAVSDRCGTSTMLAAKELADGQNNPLSQMSSLQPEVVEKHAWMVEAVDDYVESIEVATTTLPALFEEHGIERLDGLFVDTEGHDKVVLDQLDLTDVAPRFIMYEHAHLPRTSQRQLYDHFKSHGYHLTRLRRDIFAELADKTAA